MPKIYTVEGFAKPLSLHQGTLYEQEGYGPYVQLLNNFGVDSFITVQILFSLYQKPILQLVDNCTYVTIAYPFTKSSLHAKSFLNLRFYSALLYNKGHNFWKKCFNLKNSPNLNEKLSSG